MCSRYAKRYLGDSDQTRAVNNLKRINMYKGEREGEGKEGNALEKVAEGEGSK